MTFVGYGLPDFGRLPGGLVSRHMLRLASDASPTDVSPVPRRRTPAVPDAIVGVDRLCQHAATPEVR